MDVGKSIYYGDRPFFLHVTGIEKRGKEYGRKEEDPAEPDTQTKQAPI